MAQTIDTIYQNLIAINNTYPELVQITDTNTSNMSLLQLLYYINASQMGIQQQYFDAFKIDLETIAKNAPVASFAWFQDKMLNFYQYSTNPDEGVLKVESPYFTPFYKTVDSNLRIIKFCSISQNNSSRNVTIKVAKDNGSGLPTQVSIDELNSVKSFVNAIQPVGLLINVVSFPSDSIKLNLEIFYDAQYVESEVLAKVKTAINTYFESLEFEGAVFVTKIEDAIQVIAGINDVRIIELFGKSSNNAYEIFPRKYTTVAGYCSFDDVNSTITLNIGK